MDINGIQKLTLLDFPRKIACTLFTGGCNLRCPFCHNASLVLADRADGAIIEEEDVFKFLRSRRGILEGVCISGGEPTLQPDLPDFIRKVKELGYAVKLDTNGTNPQMLEQIIREGLCDYVAMDIKNCPEKYAETVGIPDFSTENVEKSLSLLRSSGIPYELRTTVVRQFHTPEDLEAIGRWLGDAPAYYLQNFKDSGNLIQSGLSGFSPEELQQLANSARKYLKTVMIRGD